MTLVKSRNSLFKGEMVEKPLPALLVGEHPDEGPIYACPHCGNRASEENCGVVGAEPGCLFCNQCNGEFEC